MLKLEKAQHQTATNRNAIYCSICEDKTTYHYMSPLVCSTCLSNIPDAEKIPRDIDTRLSYYLGHTI